MKWYKCVLIFLLATTNSRTYLLLCIWETFLYFFGSFLISESCFSFPGELASKLKMCTYHGSSNFHSLCTGNCRNYIHHESIINCTPKFANEVSNAGEMLTPQEPIIIAQNEPLSSSFCWKKICPRLFSGIDVISTKPPCLEFKHWHNTSNRVALVT